MAVRFLAPSVSWGSSVMSSEFSPLLCGGRKTSLLCLRPPTGGLDRVLNIHNPGLRPGAIKLYEQ